MDSVGKKKKSQIHSWENDANYFLLIKAVLGFRLAILQIKDWHINANIMLRVFPKCFISNGNKLMSCYFKCLKLLFHYHTCYVLKSIYLSQYSYWFLIEKLNIHHFAITMWVNEVLYSLRNTWPKIFSRFKGLLSV